MAKDKKPTKEKLPRLVKALAKIFDADPCRMVETLYELRESEYSGKDILYMVQVGKDNLEELEKELLDLYKRYGDAWKEKK